MYQHVIMPPATEPILLQELKDHLRISGSDEDASLGALVSAARTLIEDNAGIALVNRTVELFLDRWHPQGSSSTSSSLPVRPVSSVTSISVLDTEGTETIWPAENYLLTPGLSPKISLQTGRRWPVPTRPLGGIKIILTTGFGPDWNHVPASLRQAVLLVSSYLYANRGDVSTGDGGPLKASGADNLLRPYRQRRL